MKTNFETRLVKAETALGLGKMPRVYIRRILETGKELWIDWTGEVKKPKRFNPGDKIITDNIPMMANKNQ